MTGDAYVVLERIVRVPGVAALAAGVMLLFLLGCWFVWPVADLFIGRRYAAGAELSSTAGGEARVSEPRLISSVLRHGAAQLPEIVVDSYNVNLQDSRDSSATVQAAVLSSHWWRIGASVCANSAMMALWARLLLTS